MNAPLDDESTRSLLTGLQEASEDQLFIMLGDQVSAGAGGLDDHLKRLLGRGWFDDKLPELRSAVCADNRVLQLREGGADGLTLATAVADVIGALVGVPAVFTIAMLVVKYGLDKLCP